MGFSPKRVHLMAGFGPAGRRFRAVCTCGWRTTPRAREILAFDALHDEHGVSIPACRLCGREFRGHWQTILERLLVVDDGQGGQALVCKGAPAECIQLARQHQADLDQVAFDGLGIRIAPIPGND